MPNHLRLHLTTDEAHWSDTAEPGIVSNAFIHSPSHWQTLWNGWNPSLVKLAQTPSILDLFHLRELCHMLTVIHEAPLAQRGVWQNWCGGEGDRRSRWGWYKHWDIFFTYKHWKATWTPWRYSTRGHQRWLLFMQTLFSELSLIFSSLFHSPGICPVWTIPGIHSNDDSLPPHPPSTSHTHTLKPPCPHCCLRLVDPLACFLLLHKH